MRVWVMRQFEHNFFEVTRKTPVPNLSAQGFLPYKQAGKFMARFYFYAHVLYFDFSGEFKLTHYPGAGS